MKKTFKKSTIEEIEKMRKWHKAGISTNEIGKRLKKNHSSVFYWLSETKDYVFGRSGRISGLPKPEWHGVSIDRFIEKRNEEKELKELNKCIACYKDKSDPRWTLTYYCGRECWHKNLGKVKKWVS